MYGLVHPNLEKSMQLVASSIGALICWQKMFDVVVTCRYNLVHKMFVGSFSRNLMFVNQCPGGFWAYIVGQDPSDSKSSRLHVDIFWFCFIPLEYILL